MARRLVLISMSCFCLALAGCATGEHGSGDASGGSTSTAEAKAPRGVPAPAGTALASITLGMSEEQVRQAAGNPSSQTTYPNGKQWIPWYFGPTHQTDYKYKGQGRVVFAHNRWSGVAKVIRVDYDPNEDGA